MNAKRIVTFSITVLLLLFFIWCFIVWREFEDPASVVRVLLFVILPPILIGTILKIFYRKNANPYRLQWITMAFTIAAVIVQIDLIFFTIYDGNHSYSVQWEREQRRIEYTIQSWIKDHAAFPGTYKSISFSNFVQKTIPFIDKGYTFQPLRYYYLSKDSNTIKAVSTIEHAYYGIIHKYILKSNHGTLDSSTTYFQLTPMLAVEEVNDTNSGVSNWRAYFGNETK